MSRYKTISGASKPTSGACKLRSSHWIHLDNHKRQSTFQKKFNLNSPCTIQYQVLLQMKRPLQNKNNGQQQEWFHFSVEFPSMICKTIPNTCFKTMWAHAYVTCTTLFPIQQILRRYKCTFMNKGLLAWNMHQKEIDIWENPSDLENNSLEFCNEINLNQWQSRTHFILIFS